MRRTTTHRVAWGLLDQVLSSLSNFVVLIIVARSLPAEGFGAFALAMEVYVVAIFIGRGLASDPLAAAHASDDADQARWAVRSGGATVVLATTAILVLVASAGFLVGGQLGKCLLALAIFLPGLALQDFMRYALIVRGQAKGAFLNDLFWMVAQIPLLLVAIGYDGGSAALMCAWGLAGNLAALLGLAQAKTWLAGVRNARAWLSKHRTLWPYFLLDNVVVRLTTLALVVLISIVTNLTEVAGFRAAMTIYAPFTILGRGVVGVAVPELARRRDDPFAVRRAALAIAWFMTPFPIVWAVLSLMMSDSLGEAFLGDSWAEARPLLLYAGIITAGGLFTGGVAAGLRALGAGREGLAARFWETGIVFACAIVGGLLGGVTGVFAVLAIAAPLQMVTWWRFLSLASRKAFSG
jgi:O-antigen/teichoic acid export membrane protein